MASFDAQSAVPKPPLWTWWACPFREGIKPGALLMLGKRSTAEIYSQPHLVS